MAGVFIKLFGRFSKPIFRGGLSRPVPLTRPKPGADAAAAAAALKQPKVWQLQKPRGPSSKADLQAMVDARFQRLRTISDPQLLREFEVTLKEKVAKSGYAWGKDPKSPIRTSADYVKDVLHNQGKELADSVRQLARLPDALDVHFDEIVHSGFSPGVMADLEKWVATGPVLVEFQRRVHANPDAFAKLVGVATP